MIHIQFAAIHPFGFVSVDSSNRFLDLALNGKWHDFENLADWHLLDAILKTKFSEELGE